MTRTTFQARWRHRLGLRPVLATDFPSEGKIVQGDSQTPTTFSEYWTFIRRRGVRGGAADDRNCPSCGAALKISMAGNCEYCGGKVTSGEFDWVLSRIEQDEAYAG